MKQRKINPNEGRTYLQIFRVLGRKGTSNSNVNRFFMPRCMLLGSTKTFPGRFWVARDGPGVIWNNRHFIDF